jgi:RNA polymerase sigma-70 factor (ECF subfamily)
VTSHNPELAARFVNDALPYLTQLNNRARRICRNAVDAEDLVQETVVRAFAGFNTFSDGTNFRAWLFRIMANTYVNGLRREQHRPSEYLSDHITDQQLAACEGTLMWRLHRGRERLRTLLLIARERA